MCATCGCSGGVDGVGPAASHHAHGHDGAHPAHTHDGHDHLHPHVETHLVDLERDVLHRNDHVAERVRHALEAKNILALNLISSPGSGKTTLLERTIRDLSPGAEIRVIEGDQETSRDADRIRAAGARAIQINTGTACHLDASTVERAVAELSPPARSILFLENVGNLVCPALFDLGETRRVVVASVTEGDDKPLKYPHVFRGSHLVVLNKTDLLPYVPFDVRVFRANLARVNPRAAVVELSALRGDGLPDWYGWIGAHRAASIQEV
jgi:hydrogenase nickel incorporation protein HypB